MRFIRLTIWFIAFALAPFFARAAEFEVKTERVFDKKAVLARVETVDVTRARARVSGNLVALDVDEGASVKEGQAIALIRDSTLGQKIAAAEANLAASQAELRQAETEFDRARQLFERGNVSQARLDDAATKLDVAKRSAEAADAGRAALVAQQKEGEVLSPSAGRVLSVPAVKGAYLSAGETVATIACNCFILRMELPERHARFLQVGDAVTVGPRGLERTAQDLREGIVRQVYPELRAGRVVADVDVSGLGDYFVGERALVYVATDSREVIRVPESFVSARFGVSFVQVAGVGEVIVRRGSVESGFVEILSGVRPGDRLVAP